MVRIPFFGDMLNTLFERSRTPVRLRSKRSIEDMCAAFLAEEGEVWVLLWQGPFLRNTPR
jgi:hypothetical protein